MSKPQVFYYHFKPLNGWLVLNIVLLAMLGYCLAKCPCLLWWWQSQVLIGTFLFSVAVWGYKYLCRHTMAVIDDKSITIDHCRPLLWKDVESAEERLVRCGFRKLKVIVLIPKQGIDYKYNFLQKHNGDFTPFSVPLYGILTVEDEAKITKVIAKKVKIKPLAA